MRGLKKLRFELEFAAFKFVRLLMRLLPLRAAREFGAILGWKAYRIFRIRRKVALENIHQSLPYAESKTTADAIACASYCNLGRSAMEFLGLDRLDPESVRDIVDFESLAPFDDALAAGRGAVLFTGHLGNWELGAAAIAARGYPVRVVAARQSNSMINKEINRIRERHVKSVIDRGDRRDIRTAFEALAGNEIVAFVADQDAREHGAFVDFLGRPASSHKGPAQFSVRRGAPLVAGFIHRLPNGKHSIHLDEPIWPDANATEDQAVLSIMQRYTDALSGAVRKHPTDYFWAHRRWKTKP